MGPLLRFPQLTPGNLPGKVGNVFSCGHCYPCDLDGEDAFLLVASIPPDLKLLRHASLTRSLLQGLKGQLRRERMVVLLSVSVALPRARCCR